MITSGKVSSVIVLCVLGSLLRLLYGYYFTPWNQAPDHLAWEILLKEGSLVYDQLIHYPHEGGSILVSILSHFAQLFTNFNSLTISAFVLDFASRFIQLSIVQKVFNRKVFYAFGLWTIFATPTIIPWGTVNFGLHSISSFFPFVLLFLLWLNRDTAKFHLIGGLFLGFAIWFSYSNVVLVPVYFLFQMVNHKDSKRWLYALSSLAGVLLFHLIVRYNADAGFHLESVGLTSIRGTQFLLNDAETWKRLYEVWFGPLANSAIATQENPYLIESIKYLWVLLFLIGIIGFVKDSKKNGYHRSTVVSFLTIFTFVAAYSISPFYYDAPDLGRYVSYRHLTYILPFIALFTIVGLYSFKFKYGTVLVAIFLLIGVYSSSLLFTQKPSSKTLVKPAGWVLGTKLGHDPERLYRIISSADYDKSRLIEGAGWGISTALFKNIEHNVPETVDQKIDVLITTINHFPDHSRNDLIEGVKFSFSDVVTPRLEKDILPKFLNELERREGDKTICRESI